VLDQRSGRARIEGGTGTKLGLTMKPPATVALDELPPDQEVKVEETRAEAMDRWKAKSSLADFASLVPASRGAHRRPLHPRLASSLFLDAETEPWSCTRHSTGCGLELSANDDQRSVATETTLSLFAQAFELEPRHGDRSTHQD
jgi:hypothetical protein